MATVIDTNQKCGIVGVSIGLKITKSRFAACAFITQSFNFFYHGMKTIESNEMIISPDVYYLGHNIFYN